MDITEHLKRRRSIRKWKDKEVEEEKIRKIIESGLFSPSSMNSQPWRFFIIKNKDVMKELSEELLEIHSWARFLKDAPVGIVVTVNSKLSRRHFIEDGSIAAFSMWLTASDLGLGGMWYAVYGDERREQIVRKILNIPEYFRIICIMCIGYPAEKPKEKSIKTFEEVVEVVE